VSSLETVFKKLELRRLVNTTHPRNERKKSVS